MKEAPLDRMHVFTACAIHCNMDVGLIARHVGGNCTAECRDMDGILEQAKPFASQDDCQHLERILRLGTPSFMSCADALESGQGCTKRGNHPSIDKHVEKAKKTLVKETKHNCAMTLPAWLVRFMQHPHMSPAAFLAKPGKNGRLLFDGSANPFPGAAAVNDMTSIENEPVVSFQHSFTNHLARTCNLRTTCPNEEICLWDDDKSGAFRQLKHNPDITSAMAF